MDALFPWRKQPPHPGAGEGDGGYASLPHPQEHARHYGAPSSRHPHATSHRHAPQHGEAVDDGAPPGDAAGGNIHPQGPLRESVMQSFVSSSSGGTNNADTANSHGAYSSRAGRRGLAGSLAGARGGEEATSHYETQEGLTDGSGDGTQEEKIGRGNLMSRSQMQQLMGRSEQSLGAAARNFLGDSCMSADPSGPSAQDPSSGRKMRKFRGNIRGSYAMHTVNDSDRSGDAGEGIHRGVSIPKFREDRIGGRMGGMGPVDEDAEYDDDDEGEERDRPQFREAAPLLDRSHRSHASDTSPQHVPQDRMSDAGYFEEEHKMPPPDRRAMMAAAAGPSGSVNQSSRSFMHPSMRSFMHQSSRSFMHQSGYSNQSARTLTTATDSGLYEEEDEDLPVSPLRQLLDAVNMSVLPASLRLASLAQAVEFFDHRERATHDAELREGAAFVLYQKLGLALRLSQSGEAVEEGITAKAGGGHNGGPTNHYASYQRTLANSLAVQRQAESDKEIAVICSCLEMVHRANPDAVAQAWDACGIEILPLLVQVLERPFRKIERAVATAVQSAARVPGSLERAAATAVSRDQKLAAQKVTKVLATYSLVPEAKGPMAACAGMLRWLTRIIDTHNYNRVAPRAPAFGGSAASGVRDSVGSGEGGDSATEQKAAARRLELETQAASGAGLYMTEAARFNTIATLTNLAALEDNRMPMLREPGLLDNICRAVHNERSDVPKQCSALAIMNLSNGDVDHVPEMARNDLVLETLLMLMKEDNPETRRNAVVTIFNVACSDQNTVRLARYRDGVLLEALVELVGSDDPVLRDHDEARANAAETLFNMSCSDLLETTDRMANHAGLLECLAVTLRGEHTGLEVKMYCSATLRRMAELVRHPMIAQGALLSALVKAATWTSTDCIAEAFRAQAAVPENAVVMARHHGLLNALSRLALTRGEGSDVEKVRMAACRAIELMSRQAEARALLSQNEGIIMALTKASYGEDPGEEALRTSNVSELGGSVTGGGFLDASDRTPERSLANQDDDEEDGDSDDDLSLQSRRIQVALKNLVAAM
ncbi:hypothetical protein ACHAXT_001754 [Thalassiosira profunda]